MKKIIQRFGLLLSAICICFVQLGIEPALASTYSHSHSHGHTGHSLHHNHPNHTRTGGRISGGSFKARSHQHIEPHHFESHSRSSVTAKNNISKFHPTSGSVTRTGGRISGSFFHEAKTNARKRSKLYHEHTTSIPRTRQRIRFHQDRITTKPIEVNPEIRIPANVRLTPRHHYRLGYRRPFFGIFPTHPAYYYQDQIVIEHHNPVWGLLVNLLLICLILIGLIALIMKF